MATRKKCFKCLKTKSIDKFYPHPRMRDGHLNKCSECCRNYSKGYYYANHNKVMAYERLRAKKQDRRRKCAAYQKAARKRNPEKQKAWNAVRWAIQSGKLTPQPCEGCGDHRVQAHHDDYSKPLEIRWLCFSCHRGIGHGQIATASKGFRFVIARRN